MVQETSPALSHPPRYGLVGGVVKTARPRQWLKNLLVFAAPGAAGVVLHADVWWRAVVAFVAFCMAASGTYFLNDLADLESDRAHAKKRFRPMAAGALPPVVGGVVGVALLVGSVGVGFLTGHWQFVVVLSIYVALTTSYSRWLKHVPIFDIIAVALGFLLRAIGGGSATDVKLSNWFLLVATFGSLFMVVGKRHAEHRIGASSPDGHVRAVLAHYTHDYLNYLRAVSSAAVLVSYCLFAFDSAAVHGGRIPWFQLSILPFSAGILRYGLLLEAGQGENPEDVVLADRTLLLTGITWLLIFALGTYASG